MRDAVQGARIDNHRDHSDSDHYVSLLLPQKSQLTTPSAATATHFTENTLIFPTWTGLESYVAALSEDPFGESKSGAGVSSTSGASISGSSTSSAVSGVSRLGGYDLRNCKK